MDDEKKLTKEQMEIVVGGVEEDQSMEETYEPTPAYVITDDCISWFRLFNKLQNSN